MREERNPPYRRVAKHLGRSRVSQEGETISLERFCKNSHHPSSDGFSLLGMTAVMSFGLSGRSRGEGSPTPRGDPQQTRTGTPCDSCAPILDCSTRPFLSVTSPYKAALMPKMTPKTDLQALPRTRRAIGFDRSDAARCASFVEHFLAIL